MFISSPFISTIRVMVNASPLHATGISFWILWRTVQPLLYTLAVGGLVGEMAAEGIRRNSQPHFGQADRYLYILVALFIANLCFSALADATNGAFSWRIRRYLGERMLSASSRPASIAYLDDPCLADRIAFVRGQITNFTPQRLVTLFSSIVSTRLSGATMAILLFGFHWWAPFAIGAAAIVTRSWLLQDFRAFERGLQFSAPTLRRATYFRDLAITSAPAKELRIFNVLDWALEQFFGIFQRGLSEVRRERAQTRGIMIGAVLLQAAAFGLVAASVAVAGSHAIISPGKIAIYLQAAWGMLGMIEAPAMEYEFRPISLVLHNLVQLETEVENWASKINADQRMKEGRQAPRQIRFENITFRYPGETAEVLKNFNLNIRCGGSIAIVGANGAGKSTIINLLTYLYKPQHGRVLVDGIDLEELDLSSWRQHIAAVFQEFCRWPLSLRENVNFGAERSLLDDTGLWTLLKKVGAESFVRALPNGPNTVLSKLFRGGTELSGGQWQRVALARAMAAVNAGAKILILDEPTAHLDARGEAEFWRNILRDCESVTTIITSHRFSTIRRAQRIVVLENGKIVEDGSHEELLKLGGSYARKFNLQAEQCSHELQEH